VNTELDDIWSRVQAELARAVGEATYSIWLEPLSARDLTEGTLFVEVKPEACDWVRNRYGQILRVCAERILGEPVTVELAPVMDSMDAGLACTSRAKPERGTKLERGTQTSNPKQPLTSRYGAQGGQTDDDLAHEIGLIGNPKLTFDQFVIGDCNRLAHAAALTVAEMPAQAYNPLFICGPPGVGKTHLLSSIASLLLAHNPSLSVRCTTGEAFTNEFLGALSGQRIDTFKARHRRVDVLLVDDVQFLERKTRTEEEFFHTFNSLYDAGRQLVLTSDRPPRDLQALEDRLRERFEAGLVADIHPPDPATRMTILRKRAQHDQLALQDESPLRLIADSVTENIRAIEGALIRVVAFSSLTGRPLTAELTHEVLDGLYPETKSAARRGPLTVDEIALATCKRYGLTLEELRSSSRAARVAWPRQVAMYLARELTDQSLPAIGRQLGGRDHTTVLHACRKATQRMATEHKSRETVDELLESLGHSIGKPPNTHPDRPA
jgi:chromosomal replication initiator protein